jgi:hypothetical protein
LLFPFIVLQYAAAARAAAAASSNLNQRKGDPIMPIRFNTANTLESFRSLGGDLRRSLSGFHKEEEGQVPIENILMIFIAATILIGLVKWLQPNVITKVNQKVGGLFGELKLF